jgi:hypothetical protein
VVLCGVKGESYQKKKAAKKGGRRSRKQPGGRGTRPRSRGGVRFVESFFLYKNKGQKEEKKKLFFKDFLGFNVSLPQICPSFQK